ncbi:hypothetical protein GC175_00805 [bacterium]|nr:hypothetical protein [bacterium]
MTPQRPDLSQLPEAVRAYIEYLEDALTDAQSEPSGGRGAAAAEPSEAPTTQMVVTITRTGTIKRTPRHLYGRQRRGGMGVFDIESNEDDPPTLIAVGDLQERLILFTDRSRFFSLRISELPEAPVRARGEMSQRWLPLQPDEKLVVALPEQNAAYFYLLSDRGWVRRVVGSQLLRLAPGSVLEARPGHRPVSACWGTGDRDLLIVSKAGQGIRFEERLVPIQGGCLGIRLDGGDEALSIANVNEASGVFVLGDDGKGTIRQMAGVRANKSPGAGGKTIMKADRVVDARTVAAGEDVFVISQLAKLIRFAADEVPPKEGVVQGVNCMSLRADEAMAFTVSDAGIPLEE